MRHRRGQLFSLEEQDGGRGTSGPALCASSARAECRGCHCTVYLPLTTPVRLSAAAVSMKMGDSAESAPSRYEQHVEAVGCEAVVPYHSRTNHAAILSIMDKDRQGTSPTAALTIVAVCRRASNTEHP